MNDVKLDTLLVAATNRRSDDTNNFVEDTMRKIRVLHTADNLYADQIKRTKWWHQFTRLRPAPRIVLTITVAAIASIVVFTGYAYAIGSDPISLIKRWVAGNSINVEYNGRKFQYGKARTYSDAAITAYAELNTVRSLDFRAENTFGTPVEDTEYLSDVLYKGGYIYPTLGTITVSGDRIILNQQYLLGDKMNPSHDISSSITTNMQSVQFYRDGNPASPNIEHNGQPVAIFTNKSLAHNLTTNAVSEVTTYFVFALSHPLKDFKEADKNAKPSNDQSQTPLYEPNWGGLSNLCLNNPADICNNDRIGRNQGQGLFVGDSHYSGGHASDGIMNPDALPWGETAATPAEQPAATLNRMLQGAVVDWDDSYVVIRTSSGAKWKLNIPTQQRASFAQHFPTLKIGDQMAGMVLQPIYDLNNRTVDSPHILSLMRL